MRLILCFLLLCSVVSTAQASEKDQFRFGLQTSLNSYRIDDPDGATARGNGFSISGISLVEVGRASRLMIGVDKQAFNLGASTINVGQDVSSLGGGLSYQSMFPVSRTWKPWVGVGLGYTSTKYTNRFRLTPSGQFSTPLADRSSADLSWLLNTNTEWVLNRSWDIGLQAQLSSSFSNKSSSIRVGLYAVY